ncbi:hypothetical protein C8Q80DRAFT_620898 [Daedaleopsis nitida]|nr:hypothetical protein C8Q80DRAFT_620898 [Daedaleopsis nitida]
MNSNFPGSALLLSASPIAFPIISPFSLIPASLRPRFECTRSWRSSRAERPSPRPSAVSSGRGSSKVCSEVNRAADRSRSCGPSLAIDMHDVCEMYAAVRVASREPTRSSPQAVAARSINSFLLPTTDGRALPSPYHRISCLRSSYTYLSLSNRQLLSAGSHGIRNGRLCHNCHVFAPCTPMPHGIRTPRSMNGGIMYPQHQTELIYPNINIYAVHRPRWKPLYVRRVRIPIPAHRPPYCSRRYQRRCGGHTSNPPGAASHPDLARLGGPDEATGLEHAELSSESHDPTPIPSHLSG